MLICLFLKPENHTYMQLKPGFALISALFLLVGSCKNKTKSGSTTPKADVLASNMDTTMSPAEDFFQYANGGWIKNNPIPADRSSWGIGNLVNEENLKRLREISEKAAASKASKGSTEQEIGDFWSVAMDSTKIEADGLKPIQPLLDKVNAIADTKTLVTTVAELKKAGSHTLFAEGVYQDDKNSEQMAYFLWQGGLGLPEREFYFKEDSFTSNIRERYKDYIATILTLGGEDPALAKTAAINVLA